MVSSDLKHTISLIPGISLNKEDSHAFIQVIYSYINEDDSSSLYTDYIRFDINDFSYNKEISLLKIGKSTFSTEKIKLELTSNKTALVGSINLKKLSPIKTNILSPSVMGIFSYIPFMECYHSVVSMNHNLSGTIKLNDKEINFDKGKGYIEKDFGKSFPIKYIWIQSNSFKNKDTSLMVSIATIPFLKMKFKGLIAILNHNQEEYRFATYNFSKVKKLTINENNVFIILQKGRYKLKIEAKNKETRNLPSPKEGVMNQTIKEGLSGNVNISLYHKNNLIYHDLGQCAGIEIMMD